MYSAKSRWLVGGALIAGLSMGPGVGCSDFTRFEVATTASTTVEGGDPFLQLLNVAFPDLATFDLSDESEFQNQGVREEDIESVRATSFILSVASPPGQDLSFFKKIEFYVETDDLPRVLFASQTEFPDGASQVEMKLEDLELREYITADTMRVSTEVSAQQPPQDTTLKADVTFLVDASNAGACRVIQEAF